jgi:hypothetical protein
LNPERALSAGILLLNATARDNVIITLEMIVTVLPASRDITASDFGLSLILRILDSGRQPVRLSHAKPFRRKTGPKYLLSSVQ